MQHVYMLVKKIAGTDGADYSNYFDVREIQ